jgi:flagellar protein FlgJ
MDIGTTTGIALNAGKAAPAKAPRDPGLEKAAKAFEAVFLRQMIGAMRASSMGEGIFDSSATEQFRDMADAKTAENMAQTGKFGVAELLIQQFGARATAAHLGFRQARNRKRQRCKRRLPSARSDAK